MAPSPMMAIKNGGSIQVIPNSKEGVQAYLNAQIINCKTESQRCLIKAEYYRSLNRANNSRVDDMQRCLDQLESNSSDPVPGKPKKMKKEKKKWKPTGYTAFMKERIHKIHNSLGQDENAFNVAAKEWKELDDKAKGEWKTKAAKMSEQDANKTAKEQPPIQNLLEGVTKTTGSKRSFEDQTAANNDINGSFCRSTGSYICQETGVYYGSC